MLMLKKVTAGGAVMLQHEQGSRTRQQRASMHKYT
jgi:hypothetical protein